MRLVMFDMDGTLIDSGAMIFSTMTSTFASHGLELPSLASSHSVIGLSLEKAMEQLAGCDEETARTLAATYRKEYRARLTGGESHEPLYAGAREAVDRLTENENTLLGIATGKGLQGVNRILSLHGILSKFSTFQTPDHNPSKPHPSMLLRAMEEIGTDPRDTVMIGDTTFDMELAVAAGTRAIGVTWGYHPREQLEQSGADIIIESFEALDNAIDKVLN